jgi:hypothetical protein
VARREGVLDAVTDRAGAGTWTVCVYGRINIPTQHTGTFETYDER